MSDKRMRKTSRNKGYANTEQRFPSGSGACQVKPGTMPSANKSLVQGSVENRSTTTKDPGGGDGMVKKFVNRSK